MAKKKAPGIIYKGKGFRKRVNVSKGDEQTEDKPEEDSDD